MAVPAWFKHAFSVDDGPLEPTPEQAELIDRLAREVVRRGMTAPALAFLEMSQPLNYVASQAMQFFSPMVTAIFDAREYQALAKFLEHRKSVNYICEAIERKSAEQG